MSAAIALSGTGPEPYIGPDGVEPVLEQLAGWGKTTTVILHGGCVFEFKGDFPRGQSGRGYYNLDSGGQGFEGHLDLSRITRITFQERPHRGRESCALVFRDGEDAVLFKVFVGRHEDGRLIETQVSAFRKLMRQSNSGNSHE